MSNSRKKTKIFGNAGSSEKQDKRINNRMFRRKENIVNNEIEKEIYDRRYLDFFEGEAEKTETTYPINMNEVRNVWSMDKDGKSYWMDAPEKAMRK